MTNLHDEKLKIIAHQTTKAGKTLCGDDYFYKLTDDYFICVVADGLGSGEFANEASTAVTATIREHYMQDVEELMKLCNQALVHKRGAAVCIFKINFVTKQVDYSCVGNIRFFLYAPNGKLTYPLPVHGYLSGRPQIYKTQRFCYEPNSKFLVFSDGFNVQGVKNLLSGFRPIETISETIIQEHQNEQDDSTFILGSLL